MKRFIQIMSVSALLSQMIGCANEADLEADKGNFTRIYDSDAFNTSYNPIDMVQTPDGGFLMIASRRLETSNFSGIYILRVDEFGAFEHEMEVDEEYVNPVGRLLENQGNYYFFCMSAVGLQTHLVELNDAGEIGQFIPVGSSYPLAATKNNANFLLLSYDNVGKQSVLSVVNQSGSTLQTKGFSIGAGDEVEEPLINHFIRTGRQYPFQAGVTSSGQYFFNGFYNYTFSLVFTDLNQDSPLGVVQGQQDDGGISQVYQTGNGQFAASRFNFGDNYLIPIAPLSASGISSSTDLGGNALPELTPNAPVMITSLTLNAKEVVVYGSYTLSRQIAIFFYDRGTGEFLGSRYFGFTNPFEFTSMTTTADGGLALCGTTYLAGRFPRICLIKLSESTLSESLQ